MDNESTKSKLIRDTRPEDRPREKALKHGLDALTDTELMALVFSTGIKGKSVIALCDEILQAEDNDLWQLTNLSIEQMCTKFKGIGVAKASTLLAGLTLGKRAALEHERRNTKGPVTCSDVAYLEMKDVFQGLQHEEFWIAVINRAGKILQRVQISRGGTAATTVDVKLILKAAINHLCSSIILFHNHPSGTLRPSPEDDRLTKKIVEAARMIDVHVHDHIIVTDNGYYSYADTGRL